MKEMKYEKPLLLEADFGTFAAGISGENGNDGGNYEDGDDE